MIMNENENIPASEEQERYVPAEYRENKNPVLEILICFLIMIGFLAIQVVVMVPFIFVKMAEIVPGLDPMLPDTEKVSIVMDSLDTMTVSLAATFVSTLVAVFIYRKFFCRGYGVPELKASCRKWLKPGILGGLFFAAAALYFLTYVVVNIIAIISPSQMEQYNDLMESAGIGEMKWYVIVMTVILAPINEECIMRGIILTRLKRKMAPVIAIVISAIFFGIFHMNVVQGIYAGIMGLFMAYIAYKYNSVLPSMVFHAIFNALNYLISLIPTKVQEALVPEEGQSGTFFLYFMLIVCAALWYFLEGRKKLSEKG